MTLVEPTVQAYFESAVICKFPELYVALFALYTNFLLQYRSIVKV